MIRALAAFTLAVGLTCGGLAMADRVLYTYAPDGGAVLPRLSARKAIAIANEFTVAICVASSSSPPSGAAPCWPLAPGEKLYLDVGDAVSYSFRTCSGATTASCLPDAGVVTLEVN